MGRIWDFLMRRKPMLFGLTLIFIVSAAFSSVYLRPNVPGPVNVPTNTSTTEVIVPTPELESEPTPEPEPIAEPITEEPKQNPESTIYANAPTPEEIVALGAKTMVPRTNFGFTIPGNIVNVAALSQLAIANRQHSDADAVQTWHYIVSSTTAALIFGGVMVCLARFLSKNMLS